MPESRLFEAVRNGTLEDVKRLLSENTSVVNDLSEFGYTALHWVCECNGEEFAELLIQHGADVNATNKNGSTPLHCACIRLTENAKLVELLLKHGASVNAKSWCQRSPLYLACDKGYAQVCEVLLKHGADVMTKIDDGTAPLHAACAKGLEKACEVLIKKGADMNAANKLGHTPLHSACRSGNKELCQFLIQKGAVVEPQSGCSPLHAATRYGDTAICKLLLKHGASLTTYDANGLTPLHSACYEGRLELCQLFLKSGADANGVDKHGHTPLIIACRKGHTESAKLLLKNGANVNAVAGRAMSDFTALHTAVLNGHLEVVVCLLQYKADVSVQDSSGRTALDVAGEKRLDDIVALLENPSSEKDATKRTVVAGRGVIQPQMRRVVQQVQQNIQPRGPTAKKTTESKRGPTRNASALTGDHIMISYQWNYQKTVIKIRDELRKRNFRVWLDIDHMTGNIMDAMAEAVEGATVVLMCVSASYKDSKNCRAEIEYADERKKPIVPLMMEQGYRPTGWLGVMMGKKLFFDFSGKYPFQAKIEELVRELERQTLKT